MDLTANTNKQTNKQINKKGTQYKNHMQANNNARHTKCTFIDAHHCEALDKTTLYL